MFNRPVNFFIIIYEHTLVLCFVIVLTRLYIFSSFKFCTDEIQAVIPDMSEIELGSDIWDEDYFPGYSKSLNFLKKISI